MERLDFPENIENISGDHRIYKGHDVELILEEVIGGQHTVSLNMYLADHTTFPDIVPDEECTHVDSNKDPSDVSGLPSKYESLYMDAVDELNNRGLVSSNNSPKGVCTTCMTMHNPNGILVFVSFFK